MKSQVDRNTFRWTKVFSNLLDTYNHLVVAFCLSYVYSDSLWLYRTFSQIYTLPSSIFEILSSFLVISSWERLILDNLLEAFSAATLILLTKVM